MNTKTKTALITGAIVFTTLSLHSLYRKRKQRKQIEELDAELNKVFAKFNADMQANFKKAGTF